MRIHPGNPALGLPPQRQIPDAPAPDPEMAALLYQASWAGSHETDADWTCPGCGCSYEDIPVGHVWSYGRGPGEPGSCHDPQPIAPHEFTPENRSGASTGGK